MVATDRPGSPRRPRRERLRFSTRSVVMAVGALGATLALLALVAAARRVIGWILVAATTAGLLHPIVTYLQRRMRRGLAVALVMLLLVGSIGTAVYALIDDVRRETDRLQEAAPQRARQLERSQRFGPLARDLRLEARTRQFVKQVPERLRGGTPAEALRAAGSRGVAFLATTVLTVFFLLHGPALAAAATRQIPSPGRRARFKVAAIAVYRRSFGYASATLVMAVAAGLFAYAAARWAGVPGPAPLGIWVGLWDLVPLAGAFVGALPIVVLAAAASTGKAVALALVFVAYQLVEDLVVQRRVERASIRLGPFLTLAAGLVGLELSGVAGSLLSVLATTIAVAAAETVADADVKTASNPPGS